MTTHATIRWNCDWPSLDGEEEVEDARTSSYDPNRDVFFDTRQTKLADTDGRASSDDGSSRAQNPLKMRARASTTGRGMGAEPG
jgi:hypothetical protein